MGREKRARLKRVLKNFWRTCRCSHHHESAYPRRSKSLQQTTDATLTTTAKESAWSYASMHDMTNMMQCNLPKLSGIGIPTHTYGSSYFTTRQIKCWLTWQRQSMSELHKIKWSRENIISISHILHMLLIMWDANYHVTTWCKMQPSIWMTNSD
jgi:hypothetical protein